MADIKVEISDEAARALLNSPEVKADLLRRAHAIARAAGDGAYDVSEGRTPTRARVSVGTGDHTARKAEATTRALTKALDAGRG
jgi:hypothetical protein